MNTYDHRRMRTGHPVRSGVLKHSTGCVVVGWVTTSEFQLLYVQFFLTFLTTHFDIGGTLHDFSLTFSLKLTLSYITDSLRK